jgi:two-component sensor histidine kinase
MTEASQNQTALGHFPLVSSNATPSVALTAIVRRLSTAQSVAEVVSIVTHAARTLVGADGVTFVFRDGDLCYYADEDAISPLWKGRRFPIDACISGWCMMERRPAVIPDIYQDARIPHDAYAPTFVHSLIMVPVRQDDPIAAMGAYWASSRHASSEEVERLQAVANAASMALAQVELREERSKKLLNSELHHRMRNQLSVIHAIVRHGLRDAPEQAEAISRRIGALARANGVLTSEAEPASNLRAVALLELEPFGKSRIDLEGDEVHLASDTARILSMVFHELATNAAKYGALTTANGRVSVKWTLHNDALAVRWEELGGPAVKPANTRGFGIGFMEHLLASVGGQLLTEWHGAGIAHEIGIPLPPHIGHAPTN